MTAAVYARYSSENQKATSIEDQVTRCRDAAARFGCVVDGHVYTDQELSGSTAERPGYKSLMGAAKTHQFEAILVEAQDRLWRDQGEMHNALKRLSFYGVKVFSVAAGVDLTDRNGKMMVSVKGLMDEAYIEDLRDKTRRGMLGQVRRGLSVGGRAYGYRSEPTYNGEHQLVGTQRMIDPYEARVIRRIFKLYVRGASPKTIAHRLNVAQIPPPRASKGRKSLGWTWTTISGSPKKALGILNNPAYVGKIIWNRSQKVRDPDTGKRVMRPRAREEWVYADAPQLRIIPDSLWEAAQRRREDQRRSARGNTTGRKPTYLFSGLLLCQECGQHYVIKTQPYYGCSTHINRGPAACANSRLVDRHRLEEVILRMVFDEVFSPDTLAYVSRKVNEALARRGAPQKPTADGYASERKRAAGQLSRARCELDNIKGAILLGVVTPTTKQMLEETERRIAELEAALRAPAAPHRVTILPSVVKEYLRDLKGTLGRDTERARTLLAKLIGHVTLRRDGERLVAELRGNLPGLLGIDEGLDNPGAGRGI